MASFKALFMLSLNYLHVYLSFVLEVLNTSRTKTDPYVSSYPRPGAVAAWGSAPGVFSELNFKNGFVAWNESETHPSSTPKPWIPN